MASSEPTYSNFEKPDFMKYGCGLAGFTMDLQRVWRMERSKAVRRRIGTRGLYKAGFTRMPDGSMIAAPCARTDRRLGYVTKIHRSTDEGLTWTCVGDGPPGKEPTLLALASGSLILLTEDLQRRGNEFRCFRSTDGGETWSECTFPGMGKTTTTRAITQASDGTVRLFVSGGKWGATAGERTRAWLYESRDDGATWSEGDKPATWESGLPFFCEASILALSDEHLLTAVRVSGDFPSREGAPADMPEVLDSETFTDEAWNRMVMMETKDGGKTWSDPWPILERGNVHANLIRLRDGRILATYAVYHLPWSVQAAVSEDGGRTFDMDSPVLLTHSVWYCVGWPTSIQLDDGSIITCYAKQAYWDDRSTGGQKSDFACEVVRWEVGS